MTRALLVTFVVAAAACLWIACGDDDGLAPAEDYFDEMEETNGEAAAEIIRITSELEGTQMYEEAARAFEDLADEAEDITPAFETVVAHDAYVITAQMISETLDELATGNDEAADRLPSLVDDFEFVCSGFVDVSRAIFPEVRELDCRFPYLLIEE